MSKFSAIAAALLFSLSGAAHATVISSFAGDYSGSSNSAASTALAAPVSGGMIVDFTFKFIPLTNAGASGPLQDNDFLGFWFNNYTGPSIGLKANCGNGKCTDDLFVRLGGTEGIFIPSSDLSANTEYHLYGYLYKSAGSSVYNNFDAWLNPTSAEMSTLTGADVHAVANTVINGLTAGSNTMQSISTVGFRSSGLDNGVVVTVLATKVAAIPEPGSLALMGLALGALGLVRRPRKS